MTALLAGGLLMEGCWIDPITGPNAAPIASRFRAFVRTSATNVLVIAAIKVMLAPASVSKDTHDFFTQCVPSRSRSMSQKNMQSSLIFFCLPGLGNAFYCCAQRMVVRPLRDWSFPTTLLGLSVFARKQTCVWVLESLALEGPLTPRSTLARFTFHPTTK